QEQGKVIASSLMGLRSMETVKAGGGEDDLFIRLTGHHANAINVEQSLGLFAGALKAVPALLYRLSAAAVLALGGMQVLDGQMTLGSLVAFQGLLAGFLRPVEELVALGARLQQAHGEMGRLQDVMNYPADYPRTEGATEGSPTTDPSASRDFAPKLEGRLTLSDVTFGYSRLEPPLIESFSLHVEPGARVALVGSSGSGKSTLAMPIAGLYRPWSGEIRFGGMLREGIPDGVWTQSVAIVRQT